MKMNPTLAAFAVILFFTTLIGCQISWYYTVQNGSNKAAFGGRFNIDPDTQVRILTCMDNGIINYGIDITNLATSSLSITDSSVTIFDSKNKSLEQMHEQGHEPSCLGIMHERTIKLEHNQSCHLELRYNTTPMINGVFGIWPKPNPDLRDLTVIHDGLQRNGLKLSLKIKLHWNLHG